MKRKSFIVTLNQWRTKYIKDRNFLIIASIIIGIAAGLVAVIMKASVHYIQTQVKILGDNKRLEFLFYLFPLTGILLTVLFIHKVRKGNIGRGIANIIHSISKRSGNIPPDNTYSHAISSAVTVGFGGSVGLEAPIVVTGSAIGSNIAGLFLMARKEKIILLACGAAAGISAIFNTPIAGVLFAMEVLLAEFSIPTFIPILIASASGAVVSQALYKGHLLFPLTQNWKMEALPFYILLGISCGLLSVYFMRMYFWTEKKFSRQKNIYKKALTGGLLLAGFIFLFPPLYGEGYVSITQLVNGQVASLLNNSLLEKFEINEYVIVAFIAAIVLVKVFATSITIGAGGNGGVFAPSLFAGALWGYAFARIMSMTGSAELSPENFIAAGMAGMLSGLVHAPLTGIFLIAEITGGYLLFIPLMIVSAISYFITKSIEPYSIYTGKLAQKGIRMDNKEAILLQNISLSDITEKDFPSVHAEDFFGQVIEKFTNCNKTIFPVLSDTKEFLGVILIDEVKPYLFNPEKHENVKVKNVMLKPSYKVNADENMEKVMGMFDKSGYWYLPVIENNRFIGFASRRKLLDLIRVLVTDHHLSINL
ncbi:MAG TPA: chloride channel protein [Chitinophagaceae bacterium]|nr:chloride channel protein [Chitinophagaceae bacterium]